MKQFISLILLAVLPMLASAYDAEINGIYYDFSGDEASVTYMAMSATSSEPNKDAYSGSIVIPDEVIYNDKAYSVTRIGNNAFAGCSNLTSVIIPNSVMFINSNAFESCSNLASVTIGDGVFVIGDYAFSCCSNLTFINIPESVISIGSRAFQYCISLTSCVVPDNVKSFGIRVFLDCQKLKSCVIGNGVTSIGEGVFSNCYALADITIGSNVQFIGYLAFQGCRSLPSVIIPEGVTSMGNAAFYGCSALASVSLPNSLTAISAQAFEGCSRLNSIAVGSRLNSIGDRAFEGCNNIKDLNVRITDYYAFCYDSNSIFTQIHNQITLLDEEGNEITEYVVPEDVTSIGNYAFSGCYGLTSVIIPGSVTAIGDYAFQKCTGLTSIVIPEGVTKIGRRAFENCTNLASVTIPNSVTVVGATPFQSCNNITSIDINCENIGNNWFYSKKSIKRIVLGEHVKNLANAAFKNCTGLKEIYCYAEEPPTVSAGTFGGIDVASVMLVVPDESYEAYKAHEVWGQFWIETPTGIDSLTPTLFKGEGDWYSLDGKKLDNPQKGINILRHFDGTTRKVLR